ncbi:MAG: glycosyltransferase [Desulfobacteraceae bacterium]|nr:glycosyltransferase [Desulfobacteraceae bacterium]
MQRSPGLSVCMIVKNEAENMAEALESFKSFADEIVVVDTGSTDDTKKIATKYTSNIYDFKWIDDFSAARNYAISKARRTYQIWLDADDRITEQDQRHINSMKSMFDGKKAFYFVLENHQDDAPMSTCLQLRCLPILDGVKFEGSIHEQIFPSAVKAGLNLVTTDIAIRHMGYMTDEIRMAKARRNLEILENERSRGADYGSLYFYLALTHAPLGDKQEAIRCMEKALERFERENFNHHLIPEGYLFLTKVTYEMEDFDRCIRYLTRARCMADGNPFHNYQMGILYQRIGKHMEAIDCFREAVGKRYEPGLFPTQPLPDYAELCLHMAYSHCCMNDRQNALKLVNDSAPGGATLGKSWEWLGTKAFTFKNISLAQLAFETAARFGNLEQGSWRYLASIYESRGFRDKAQECQRHAA